MGIKLKATKYFPFLQMLHKKIYKENIVQAKFQKVTSFFKYNLTAQNKAILQTPVKVKHWPWFGGAGKEDALTTAACTDDEAAALTIQPAKALALAVAAAGGKGCMQQMETKGSSKTISKIITSYI